jgi:hypothetical protein
VRRESGQFSFESVPTSQLDFEAANKTLSNLGKVALPAVLAFAKEDIQLPPEVQTRTFT